LGASGEQKGKNMHQLPTAIVVGGIFLTCAALAAQDSTAPALPDLTKFDLMRSEPGKEPVYRTVAAAADELKNYDVILLGEWHDHPGNHLAEMDLFREIYARSPQLALSMEQFERDVQPVVNDYLAGRIGEEALLSRGHAWGNYAESYRPLVEFAKDHGLPVIAANTPASLVRCVGEKGPEFLTQLDPEKRLWAAATLHLGNGPYKDKFMHFLAEDGSHGTPASNPEAAANNARAWAAQVLRDDTMAESIALYLEQNRGHKVLHITGDFHVEGGLGTAERLKERMPALKIAVVAPVEAENPDRPSVSAGDAKNGDFLFLLRGEPKEYVSDAERKAAEEQQRANFRTRAQCKL
jgi:uncharacterized iron-regulated protein